MGSCCSQEEDCGPQNGLGNGTNESEPLAPVELPPGWKAVPSRSRPGQVAYQNIHTGERISWIPTEEAKTYKGGISKRRKKKASSQTSKQNDAEDTDAAGHENKSDNNISTTSNGSEKPMSTTQSASTTAITNT